MNPPDGYAYVGCLTCGRVDTVMLFEGETAYCTHVGRTVWRMSHPKSSNPFTAMIPVTVTAAQPQHDARDPQ